MSYEAPGPTGQGSIPLSLAPLTTEEIPAPYPAALNIILHGNLDALKMALMHIRNTVKMGHELACATFASGYKGPEADVGRRGYPNPVAGRPGTISTASPSRTGLPSTLQVHSKRTRRLAG